MQAIAARGSQLFYSQHCSTHDGVAELASHDPRAVLQHYYHKSVFDGFRFPSGVRPDMLRPFAAREAYEISEERDEESGDGFVVACSVAAPRLMDVLLGLVALLPSNLSMVLEELIEDGKPRTFQNDRVEGVVAASRLLDYEDVLLGDGFSGIGLFSEDTREEVFVDEHKIICAYAPATEEFEEVLDQFGLERRERVPLVNEQTHFHFRMASLNDRVDELKRTFALESARIV